MDEQTFLKIEMNLAQAMLASGRVEAAVRKAYPRGSRVGVWLTKQQKTPLLAVVKGAGLRINAESGDLQATAYLAVELKAMPDGRPPGHRDRLRDVELCDVEGSGF